MHVERRRKQSKSVHEQGAEEVCGTKGEEVQETGGNGNMRALFVLLTNTIWVIKSGRMRWVGHVAHTGQKINAYRVLVGIPERKNCLEDPGVDRMTIKIKLKETNGGH